MEIEDRSDIEIARRAFAGGWVTDDATRADLLKQLVDIARNPTSSTRDKTSAVKAIQAGERLSLVERETELREKAAGVLGDEQGILALLAHIQSLKVKPNDQV